MQKEKGVTENEMVGWRHRLNGHEFEQALGVGDGQGSLACCSPWGRKGSGHDLATEQQHTLTKIFSQTQFLQEYFEIDFTESISFISKQP